MRKLYPFFPSLFILLFFSLPVFAQTFPVWASFSARYIEGTEYTYDQWALTENQVALVKFSATMDGEYKVLSRADVTVQDKNGTSKTYGTTVMPPIVNPSTNPASWEYKYWSNIAKVVAFTKQYVVFQIRNTMPEGTNEWILLSYQIKGLELRPKGSVTIKLADTPGFNTSLSKVYVNPDAGSIVNVVISEQDIDTGSITWTVRKYDIGLLRPKGSSRTAGAVGSLFYTGKDVNSLLPHPFAQGYWYEIVDTVTGGKTDRIINVYKY